MLFKGTMIGNNDRLLPTDIPERPSTSVLFEGRIEKRATLEGGLTISPSELDPKERARQLRRRVTGAEQRLWSRIRSRQLGGYRFNRQTMIGDYIADFYCHQARLVIEVDGKQHQTLHGLEQDKLRGQYMESLGISVLRFTNDDVREKTDDVVQTIREKLGFNDKRSEPMH